MGDSGMGRNALSCIKVAVFLIRLGKQPFKDAGGKIDGRGSALAMRTHTHTHDTRMTYDVDDTNLWL